MTDDLETRFAKQIVIELEGIHGCQHNWQGHDCYWCGGLRLNADEDTPTYRLHPNADEDVPTQKFACKFIDDLRSLLNGDVEILEVIEDTQEINYDEMWPMPSTKEVNEAIKREMEPL